MAFNALAGPQPARKAKRHTHSGYGHSPRSKRLTWSSHGSLTRNVQPRMMFDLFDYAVIVGVPLATALWGTLLLYLF
jgi:hypothetical protein